MDPLLLNARDADGFLETYINSRYADIAKLISRENKKKRIILTIIASVILALFTVYYCLYHKAGFLYSILVPLYGYLIFRKPKSSLDEIIEEIKLHPDEDIDMVTESKKSGYTSFGKLCIGLGAIVAFTVILLCAVFAKPHFIYENSGYTVRYYTLALFPEHDVVVLNKYNKPTVYEIRGETFMNMRSLYSVTLPDSLTEIRGDTFRNCDNLTSIVIPPKVTRIGGHAFYDCAKLSSVTLPSGLKSIGSSAFRQCKSLKEIRVPKNCSIDQRSFKDSPTTVIRY